MEIYQNSWSKTTADLYKSVLIFTISGIAASVFGYFSTARDIASGFSAMSGGNYSNGIGFIDILEILATVGIIYGYWLFIKALDIFKNQVNPADTPRVASIRTSTLLMIAGSIICLIPFIGIVGKILNLIAWIILLLAYMNLKNSPTFPNTARDGASRLFIAMILEIAGWVIGIIPIIGDAIETILYIVAFFITLSGWKKISASEAPAA